MKKSCKFAFIVAFLAASPAVVSYSADLPLNTDTPLHFSLTVQPYNHTASLSSLHDLGTGLSSSGSGLKIDSALKAGSVSGGVAFLQGDALQAGFSGWNNLASQADLGLHPVFILPSEYLGAFTSLNVHPTLDTNAEGIAIHGDYELSPNLKINGAFLVAKSEQIHQVDDLKTTTEKTKWQLNLGGAYKFRDNLVYSVNFGYLDGGDIFQKDNDLAQSHSYVVKHQLNMSF